MDQYKKPENAFGEVFSSTYKTFSVQAYSPRYVDTPEYGSIILVNSGEYLIFGLICSSMFIPVTAVHSIPQPLRKPRHEIENLYPDLKNRIRDIYEALAIGYYDGEAFIQAIPPRKPLIHDLAYIPDEKTVKMFHASEEPRLEYLPVIMTSEYRDEAPYILYSLAKHLKQIFNKEERKKLWKSAINTLQEWGCEDRTLYQISKPFKAIIEG